MRMEVGLLTYLRGMLRGVLQATALILLSLTCSSQVRVMSYNLLNFPTGNIAGRVDTLAGILDYYRPHLFMIQELKTAQGLEDLSSAFNDLGYGAFEHSTFVAQQSSPGNSNPLQQAIVYDTNLFGLTSETWIETDVRDINGFRLFMKDPSLETGADTTFLWVFVTHLKSSSGGDNEQLRLQMVNTWLDWLDGNVPEESNVIFAGDFNLYSTSEPAYQALVDGANFIHMIDPLESLGNWSGSGFAHKEILTQSTRQSAIFNDGAGGGIDDRFDFILFSESLMDTQNSLHFVEGTWQSLGNNGACYNQSITECTGGSNPVPGNVIQSIYYMSDHLPQVCELNYTGQLNSSILPHNTLKEIIFPMGNSFTDALVMQLPNTKAGSMAAIISLDGRQLWSGRFGPADANKLITVPLASFVPGVYLLRLSSANFLFSETLPFILSH